MDKKEIRERMNALVKEHNNEVKKSTGAFVLNPKIGELAEEIRLLKVVCGKTGHKYVNGKCLWCDKEED